MGKYSRFFMASVIGLTFQKIHAQKDFSSLEKNHNVRAQSLTQELNATKDTLLLTSSKTIDYVYSINSEYKREIDFYNNTSSLKIPLNQLSKGKHVFVVCNAKLQIVFVVRILSDNGILAMVSKENFTSQNN